MPIKQEDLIDIFSYHPTKEEQVTAYEAIRGAAKDFARIVLMYTPSSPDQTTAIRKIREAVMTANASIALEGKY